MPEPDLTDLRVRIDAAIEMPEFERLSLRAARVRRRRRRRLAAVAGCGAVVVVAGGLAAVRHGEAPTPPTRASATGYGAWRTDQIVMADRSTGYALLRSCRPHTRQCRTAVLATRDGGARWRRLADPNPTPDPGSRLWATSPKLLMLTTWGGTPDRISTDGGEHWTDAREVRLPAGVAIPRSWPVSLLDPQNPYGPPSRNNRIRADDPLTGATLTVPLTGTHVARATDVRQGSGGTLWLAGISGRHGAGAPELAVSPDGGKSWSRVDVPHARPVNRVQIADIDGSRALLTGARSADRKRWGVKVPVSVIWTTSDDGHAWRTTPGGHPPTLWSAVVLPDGRLACIGGTDDHARLLTSGDNGRSWHTVPGAPGLTTLQRAGDRLIGQTSNGHGMAVSDDGGRHWTVHRLPIPG